MKKWFTSDTHFSHTKIIKYTGRPFATVEEMNKSLVDNWNKYVGCGRSSFLSWRFWTWRRRTPPFNLFATK